MKKRPKKDRPSNVVIYVLLSIAGLVAIFIFAQILQSLSWGPFRQDTPSDEDIVMLLFHFPTE